MSREQTLKDQNYAADERACPRRSGLSLPGCDADARIETNGTSIHVRVGGHGPAVVMLHGFGTTGDMWGHLASALIEPHDCRARPAWVGLRRKPDGGYERRIRRRTW